MAEKSNGVLTIRTDEEIKAKFKALAENLGNQGTALESLLNAYEMQNAKDVLTERKTDIEDFDTHLQAISSAFLHSLEITENTTERVKAEFQRQLESKDLTISDLQERIRQAEQAEQTAQEQATAVECELSAMNEQTSIQLANLNSELDSVKKALATATEQVTDKQSLLDEYIKRLAKAEKEADELPELKEKISIAEQAKRTAEQETERLTAELSKQKAEFEAQISMLKKEYELEKKSAVLEERQRYAEKIETLNDKLQANTNKMNELYAENDKLRKMVMTNQLNEAKNKSTGSESNGNDTDTDTGV
ncbi:MAG: hypothetical protein K2J39_12075 [Ruminococcus sp.]|nr:hypothetical protein [Ruminococcus sp.]